MTKKQLRDNLRAIRRERAALQSLVDGARGKWPAGERVDNTVMQYWLGQLRGLAFALGVLEDKPVIRRLQPEEQP